jgi:hypothetical protein
VGRTPGQPRDSRFQATSAVVSRDARGERATLDPYRAGYPDGTLKHEAESARIDALVLLGPETRGRIADPTADNL